VGGPLRALPDVLVEKPAMLCLTDDLAGFMFGQLWHILVSRSLSSATAHTN
jgi:hypothetical protein